jgi:hypothetical protein
MMEGIGAGEGECGRTRCEGHSFVRDEARIEGSVFSFYQCSFGELCFFILIFYMNWGLGYQYFRFRQRLCGQTGPSPTTLQHARFGTNLQPTSHYARLGIKGIQAVTAASFISKSSNMRYSRPAQK